MSTKFILHLDQADEAEHDQVGGKGSTLIQLYRAGFPVPPGFVVTSDAYRAFVAANGLNPHIADALVDGDSARIRAAFEEAEMPPPVAAAVRDAYVAFGDGGVAVRSSALAEDSATASFAGQHETFLEISGGDALLAAVRRCWASLWSERALTYRRHLPHTTTPSSPAMAVVVQRMVSAAWAGVAFTLDPVSGRRDAVVVEAVAGTGEALVSGRATPDRYVVRRGEERPQVGGGVLDGGRLAAVVRLARDVESWAGQAQDVEWALDEVGEVYLLQARAITAVPRNQVFQKKPGFSNGITRWTRDNVGEVIPDPATPLSWSVLDPLGNRSFAGVLRRLGLAAYPDAGLFGRFYGHVYFNQTLLQAMMSRF